MKDLHFKFYTVMMFVILGCYLVIFGIRCAGTLHTTDDPKDCAKACGNLQWLGCEGREGSYGADGRWGTADDLTCEEVCKGIVGEQGTLHLKCTISAQSCAAVNACFDQ
jgi:hypothetical protein